MKKVGSNIQNIAKTNKISGIQRVVIETHKVLKLCLTNNHISLNGILTRENGLSNNFYSSEYYKTDPILNGDIIAVSEVDLLLLLDLDYNIDFKLIYRTKQNKKVKVLAVIYDLIPMLNPEFFHEDEVTKFRYYIQYLSKVCDYIVFNSDKVKNDFLSLGWQFHAELVVIHLGAYGKNYLSPFDIKASKSIICVSTIEPRKNHIQIIKAFEELLQMGFSFHLNIVGNYGWKFDEGLILNHPEYGSRLRWFRNLSDAEVSRLYRASSIALSASVQEGFGLNIEEALANRTKVIANNIAPFNERKQDNLYFYNGETSDLVNRILEVEEIPWHEDNYSKIRTMNDFGKDLATLIRQILA
jgi:glycosyltransferase involved in cell wall biosynthesis